MPSSIDDKYESEGCTDTIELNTGALIVIDRIMNGGTDCTKPCKDTIFEAKVYQLDCSRSCNLKT